MDTTQSKSGETFKITGNWNAQSKQLKEKFSQLTGAGLKLKSGKENEPLSGLQTRLNKKRKEVIDFINNARLEKV